MLTVLRKAELARTNNFDLLQADGWDTLREDIAEDFPYLTLQDLNSIIKRGYKGELDKYKNLALNFPRIYQWVKAEAPTCLSYWHHKYPKPMRFAELMGLESKMMEKIAGLCYAGNESILRTIIGELVAAAHYRNIDSGQRPHPRTVILHNQFAQFAAEYPEYAKRYETQLF